MGSRGQGGGVSLLHLGGVDGNDAAVDLSAVLDRGACAVGVVLYLVQAGCCLRAELCSDSFGVSTLFVLRCSFVRLSSVGRERERERERCATVCLRLHVRFFV